MSEKPQFKLVARDQVEDVPFRLTADELVEGGIIFLQRIRAEADIMIVPASLLVLGMLKAAAQARGATQDDAEAGKVGAALEDVSEAFERVKTDPRVELEIGYKLRDETATATKH